MRKSTKIMVVATIIVIIVLCLTACNKTVFDTKYKFEKAHIRINDEWFDVNVSKWNDYGGGTNSIDPYRWICYRDS